MEGVFSANNVQGLTCEEGLLRSLMREVAFYLEEIKELVNEERLKSRELEAARSPHGSEGLDLKVLVEMREAEQRREEFRTSEKKVMAAGGGLALVRLMVSPVVGLGSGVDDNANGVEVLREQGMEAREVESEYPT